MLDQTEHEWDDGLGFLGPAAGAATGSVAGPIGAVVGAIVGTLGLIFGFGGGDDQATSYRPPADSAQRFVGFDDQYGSEDVAYSVDAAGLAEAARRGNRAEDVYSYYSAFISSSTHAGASSAAARVIEDAARNNRTSIARAADLILKLVGLRRIVRPHIPSTSAQQGSPQCPPGYVPNYQLRRCEPSQFPMTGAQPIVVGETPWWVWLLVGLVAVQIVKD